MIKYHIKAIKVLIEEWLYIYISNKIRYLESCIKYYKYYSCLTHFSFLVPTRNTFSFLELSLWQKGCQQKWVLSLLDWCTGSCSRNSAPLPAEWSRTIVWWGRCHKVQAAWDLSCHRNSCFEEKPRLQSTLSKKSALLWQGTEMLFFFTAV